MYIILVFVKGIGELRDLRSVEIEDITEAVTHREGLAIVLSSRERDHNASVGVCATIEMLNPMLPHEVLELSSEGSCFDVVVCLGHTTIVSRFLLA